jgi:hypothetical protein
MGASSSDGGGPRRADALALPVWLTAAAVSLLPFAFNTSPWDAVMFHVPGNQGNWWHAAAGAPFFLAYPMIALRLWAWSVRRPLPVAMCRGVWGLALLSIAGTTAVEAPFLLHLAGTSEWQRFVVLGLGFGIVICSLSVLLLRRSRIAPLSACIAGLETAYLANASLCLIVYAAATGSAWSRIGWWISLVLLWPIGMELAWLLAGALSRRAVRGSAELLRP